MKNFEYAQPRTEAEALKLLGDETKQSVVLAGGTDLMGLMKRMVVTPDRVVNIAEIRSLQNIKADPEGNVWIGAAARLIDVLTAPPVAPFAAVAQVIQGISSIQLQSQGTLVGELLRRPTCWYFRAGHGLLAERGRRVVEGDNRYHAILGNRGPAKFVSASRLAPALIALGARVRVIGPRIDTEKWLDVAQLYRVAEQDTESELGLEPGSLVTHVVIPRDQGQLSAAYEVRHGEGPDQPLAAAAVSLVLTRGIVEHASVVLGQVAPIPWVAASAARSLESAPITEQAAITAGIEAVAGARALRDNEYKIQLAQVSVKRAILQAAGLDSVRRSTANRPFLLTPSQV